MIKYLFSALSRLGTLILIGYVAWFGWQYLGPRKPEIGPMRKTQAQKLIPQIVEDIRISRGSVHNAAILHFDNDPTAFFTDQLRATIEQRGILDLPNRSLIEKIRNLLNLRHSSYGTLQQALNRGNSLNANAVLFGSIHSFETYPGGVKIDIVVNLADTKTGEIIFSRRYTKDTAISPVNTARIEENIKSVPWFKRLLGWLVIILLLPVFSISFIRIIIRKKSNAANGFVLIVYTTVDAILAYLLVGAAFHSWLRVLVFLIAIGIAFAYNVRIMTFAAKLEEE